MVIPINLTESEIMLCPNCRTENPPNAEFCRECGNDLPNNNIKGKGQEDKNNILMWIIIPVILTFGFLFRQYLAAIIAVVVVVFVLRRNQ